MNEDLRNELAAWLEFYRELGIDEFYRRPKGSARQGLAALASERDAGPAKTRAFTPPARHLAVPGPEPETSRIPDSMTLPSGLPSQVPKNDPSLVPRTPAHALNLFEAPPVTRSGPETLEEVLRDLGDCQRCKLAGGRRNIVFGQGNPHAGLVFVGEGPGADEDEQGLPFVGRAGQLLNRMLQFIGIKRQDVYICNVVKCRPPGNRTPEPDEIATCSPFLFRQLKAISPRLICCLGAPAVKTVLGLKDGILKVRGKFYDYGSAKALATVHPAYVLRNPREEKLLREDFEKIRDFLRVQH
jgi:uracil-DNA glycosylase